VLYHVYTMFVTNNKNKTNYIGTGISTKGWVGEYLQFFTIGILSKFCSSGSCCVCHSSCYKMFFLHLKCTTFDFWLVAKFKRSLKSVNVSAIFNSRKLISLSCFYPLYSVSFICNNYKCITRYERLLDR